MNLVIIFILGVLVGAIFTGIVFRLFLVGTLRVDHSDPDGPFLFLELSKRVEAVVSKKYVVLRVKAKALYYLARGIRRFRRVYQAQSDLLFGRGSGG